MHITLRPWALPMLLILLLLASVLAVAPASGQVSDTISIIKDDEDGLSNAEVAARLSEVTFASAGRVLIGRDDEFADAMTSGLLQADSPLLLVPPGGPVPTRVLEQLELLAPKEVLLLGGEVAISPEVAEELDDAGYDVQRAFGPSRFETATEIADRSPTAPDTVLIARGFAAEDATDETQAFADAMAAGGWAADEGWPILLTQTEVLTGSTRRWLEDNAIDTAFVLGGTAAISAEVENELSSLVGTVERVAGTDRFATAIEIADKRGADSASDVARVTLVEAQDDDAWAGGFSAAAHSAEFDAPIVLANEGELPQVTEDWLTGMGQAFAQVGPGDPQGIVLTCVTPFPACEAARAALGLPDAAQIGFNPADGSEIVQFSSVTVTVTGDQDGYTIAGDCLSTPVQGTASTSTVQVTAADDCTLTVTVRFRGGATQDTQSNYLITPAQSSPPPPPPAPQDDIIALVQPNPTFSGSNFYDIRLIGLDGMGEQVVAVCGFCRDLRVSPGRDRIVYLANNGRDVAVRSGDAFQTETNLNVTDPNVFYEHPQFSPNGLSVVVSRYDFNLNSYDVVIFDAAVAAQATPVMGASGYLLAGPDAVGPVPTTSTGVGALVVEPSSNAFAQTSPARTLFLSNLGGTLTPLDSPNVFSISSASLSPTGAYYAYSDFNLDEVAVGDTATATLLGRTTGPHVDNVVWSSNTRVGGIASTTTPSQLVEAQISGGTFTEVGPVNANAESVGRLGVLGSGSYMGRLTGGQLVRVPSGTAIGMFNSAGDIRNPQLVPAQPMIPTSTSTSLGAG